MSATADLRLSIVIPTKDRPRLLAAAALSVLDSLPDAAELLVVDDRSEPPVADALPDDPRLRVTVSEAEPGASGARNWGVANAKGARILFLDDDDLMLPGYPDWVLQQRADYGFSAVRIFSGMTAPPLSPFSAAGIDPVALIRPFRHQVAGLGCGFWIDREAFQRVGGIAEDIRVNEDTEFSIRLLRAGLSGLRSAAPGVMVRRHGGGPAGERGHLTHDARAAERANFFGMILERHRDWLSSRPDAAQHLLRRQLKLLARAGDVAGARAVLAQPIAQQHRVSLRLYLTAVRIAARFRGG